MKIMLLIKKTVVYILVGLIILPAIIISPQKTHAWCGDGGGVPAGFLSLDVSIQDLTSGGGGGGSAVGMNNPGYGYADYTDGGDVVISISSGGDNQRDYPIDVSASGFNSNEGNFISYQDSGSIVPGYTATFHNFHSDTFAVDATQCGGDTISVYITMNNVTPTPTFTCSVDQATATVDPGSGASYTVRTSPLNGFNSAVHFTSSINPSPGSAPSVAFVSNDQVPAAVTTANVSTQGGTPASDYTITFTGTGGGQTANCSTHLIVNALQKDFELIVQPSTHIVPNTNPNQSNIGVDAVFTVFANCTGGFTGPITDMTASTTFTGPIATLAANTLNCGATTTLTISNTGSIPSDEQSTIINTLSQSVSVTGSGQLD